MINIKKIKVIIGAVVLLLCSTVILILGNSGSVSDVGMMDNEQQLGTSFSDAKWEVTRQFDGYQTKLDPTKIANGANPQGQNTSANDKDRISVRRQGLELFPAGIATTTESGIKSLYTFRKRSVRI